MRPLFAVLVAALALGAGCRPPSAPSEGPPASSAAVAAFVSIDPQAYFVERIGGERVAVSVLVAPGQSPETYEPTATQMAALARCDVYFRIGLPFEDGLLERLQASMPDLNVVDTRAGVPLRGLTAHGAGDHEHEGGKDPHIWLAPRLVIAQARTIRDELKRLDPAGAELYDENLRAFARELMALQAEITAILRPVRGREIFVFHPSYGYFVDAFGLKQVAVEVEGKEPTPRELQALIARARAAQARAIFVQPQFSTASAEAVAREIGAQVVPLDPLARDWPGNMRAMARAIVEALAPETVVPAPTAD